MPQKVSQNFDSQINVNKTSDVEARANQLLQKNEIHSGEIKFLNDITNELGKLMSDIRNGYDSIHIKFMHLVNELNVRSKRNSENTPLQNSNELSRSPQQNKKDKFQL